MTAKYARQIATDFVSGKRPPTSHRFFAEGDTLYSYGRHYPVAMFDREIEFGGFWVNESTYYVSDADRVRAGWSRMGYQMRPTTRKTASPTTAGHARALVDAIRNRGYSPTTRTRTIHVVDPAGRDLTYVLRLWIVQ